MFKLIDKFINYLYSKKGYYNLKSGLHIDHYFKLFFIKIHKNLNFYFGLIFLEKFFLNTFINNFFYKISKLNLKFFKILKFNSFNSFKLNILFIVTFLCLIVFLFFLF